jgi:hypothetical protein
MQTKFEKCSINNFRVLILTAFFLILALVINGHQKVLGQASGVIQSHYSAWGQSGPASSPGTLDLQQCLPMFQGDVNGDGLTDLICPVDLGGAAMVVYVQEATPTGYSGWQQSGPTNPTGTFHLSACKSLQAGDANGDGKTDLICPYDYLGNTTTIVKFGSAAGFLDWQFYSPAHQAFNLNQCSSQHVGDVNGDGLTDLICPVDLGGASMMVYVQEATPTSYTGWQQSGPVNPAGHFSLSACKDLHVGDANGDGMADLICPYDYSGATTTLVRHGSTTGFSDWQYASPAQQPFNLYGCAPQQVGDVNGDGLTDLICPYDYGNGATTTFVQLAILPPKAEIGGPYSVDEGGLITLDASTSSDPNGQTLSFNWDLDDDGQYNDASGSTVSFSAAGLDGPASAPVSVQVCNESGLCDVSSSGITINNVPPVLVSLVPATPDPVVSIGSQVKFTATFSDPAGSSENEYTCYFDWDGDGISDLSAPTANDSCSATAVYSSAGVYAVKVQVADDQNDLSKEMSYSFVVVYDTSAGFVTGGGWIDSPPEAYEIDPTLTGKASFGFVARYNRGATVPDGNTQFHFKAGDLNFRSSSYEWLVVSGTNAQFKGEGTINGEGSYQFMLTADDGSPDTFRIHIWGDGGKIYDNGPQQALSGGSVVIHKK